MRQSTSEASYEDVEGKLADMDDVEPEYDEDEIEEAKGRALWRSDDDWIEATRRLKERKKFDKSDG